MKLSLLISRPEELFFGSFYLTVYRASVMFGLLVLTVINTSTAQVFDFTSTKESKGGLPPFDSAYIKKSGIYRINVTVSHKDDGLPIKKSTELLTFEFNDEGLPVLYRKTKGFTADTVKEKISYNQNLKPTKRYYADLYAVKNHEYEYDEKGGLIKSVSKRSGRTDVPAETLYYTNRVYADTLRNCIAEDENGIDVYREIKRFDKNGNLRYYARLFEHSVKRRQVYYTYRGNQLTEIKVDEKNQLNAHRSLRTVLKYEQGRVTGSKTYNENKPVKRTEYLFENDILDAVIYKDLQSGKITIMQFDYKTAATQTRR